MVMKKTIYVDVDDMDVEFFSWGAEVKYCTPDCDEEYILFFESRLLEKEDRELWDNDLSTPFSLRSQRSHLLKQNIGRMFCELVKDGEKDDETRVEFFSVPKYVDVEECKREAESLVYSVDRVHSKGFSVSKVGKEYVVFVVFNYDEFFSEHTSLVTWRVILEFAKKAKQTTIQIFHAGKRDRIFIGTLENYELWI